MTHFISISALTVCFSLLVSNIFPAESSATDNFLHYHDLNGKPYSISADERSWMINGQRTLLLGGSVHYPRLSPGQWKDILTKMLNDGLNHAQIYVFWNIHEPLYNFSGNHHYNYEGRANITGFLSMAAEVGLFVNLRIGPYVCAEWSFGGLPTWLLHVPNIMFRANNDPWKQYMQTFVEEISRITEPYLAKNGGPIILAQIENEYDGSQEYVNWCGNLVTSLNMNISWVMCNGLSASNTINTCNDLYCYPNYINHHSQNYPGQPLGWTENEGMFQEWDIGYDPVHPNWDNRPAEQVAYSVASWIGGGGSHMNYYMYYGGNHVSWTAGSGITNYYADSVNYHGDGTPNEPKTSHLIKLHNILADIQVFLLEDDIQFGHEIPLQNNDTLEHNDTFAYQYHSLSLNKNVTFLYNTGNDDVTVIWENKKYFMASQSVIILDNMNNVLFNTDDVNITGIATQRVYETIYDSNNLKYSSWTEELPYAFNKQNRPDHWVYNKTPLEQIRFTNNTFEYLIYSTNFSTDSTLNAGTTKLVFHGRTANAYILYIDGIYQGQAWDGSHIGESRGAKNYSINILQSVAKGIHSLSVVSSSLGIDNSVMSESPPDAQDMKGIMDYIKISSIDITANGWYHWIGTTGEILNVAGVGMNKISWRSPPVLNEPLTWFRTSFITPNASIILLDIGDSANNKTGFNRGHFWLNGMDMGHYNNVVIDDTLVQRYYFIPNDYLIGNKGNNSLVFCEEIPAVNPANVKIVFTYFKIPENK
eukprot:454988_1